MSVLHREDTDDPEMEGTVIALEDLDNEVWANGSADASILARAPRQVAMSLECECGLIQQAQAGDRVARDRLVFAYLPMIQTMAADRARRLKRVSREDLIQEAVLGVLRAIDRFTANGTPFEHYARRWIRGSMLTEIEKQLLRVRVPRPVLRLVWRYWAVEQRLAHARGRSPSFGDVVGTLGITSSESDRLRTALNSLNAVSLDCPPVRGGADSAEPFLARLPDERVPTPEEAFMAASFTHRVEQALKKLHFWERDILMLRIEDGLRTALPYGHIGLALGISRREVRTAALSGLKRIVRMHQHGAIMLS